MDKYFYCLCLDESGNYCNFIKQKCHGNIEDRPKWCPLVEVQQTLNDVTITPLDERAMEVAEVARQILKYYSANPKEISKILGNDFDVDKSLRIALDDNGWDK